MKRLSIIAVVVAAAFLWIGCNSAFADPLVWQTSKEAAVAKARAEGKLILLVGGAETCSKTEYALYTLCEKTSPPIKSLIQQYFVPWFGNRDAALNGMLANTDWYKYGIGLGEFDFPLICVIDPKNPNIFSAYNEKAYAYLDRTEGKQTDVEAFYNRLLSHVSGTSTCSLSLAPLSKSFNASSGNAMINVTSSCSWGAASNASWITITAGSTGTGNGTVSYSVSANTTGSTRSGKITIGGEDFDVVQTAQSGIPTTCGVTISPTSSPLFEAAAHPSPFGPTGNTGTVEVTASASCSWSAASNDSWITIKGGATGTGNATVYYSVSDNTSESIRTGTITIGGQTFTVTQNGTQSSSNASLYFPHIDTTLPWQTEIAIINMSDQNVNGTLKAFSNAGVLGETQSVALPAYGRRQIDVGLDITEPDEIGYIIFESDSDAVHGYAKFYQDGVYRTGIPAVKELNTADIYIPHIASNDDWWTGVSLVNTTSEAKELTIVFNNGSGGLSMPFTLDPKEHKVLNIERDFFDYVPQPDIQSAVISNAEGIIGLELFGSTDGIQLDGIILNGNSATTLYYPHIASGDGWWTGIAAYNTSAQGCTMTVTPYAANGTPSAAIILPAIGAKEKFSKAVTDLGLPADTAWFKVDSTTPLTGFELISQGSQVAAYAGGSAMKGVFPKIEKYGWTGLAFVNTEDGDAHVTLTAYKDDGTPVGTKALVVGAHAKEAGLAASFFTEDISSATYIAYSSDRNIAGLQLNGSADGTMLDGLPALPGNN